MLKGLKCDMQDWCEVFFRSLMHDLFYYCVNPVLWNDKQLKECVLTNGSMLSQQILLLQPDDLKMQKLNVLEIVNGQYDMINHRISLYFSRFRFGDEFSFNMPSFRVFIFFNQDGTAVYTIEFEDAHIRDANNPLFRRFLDKARPFYSNNKQLTLPAFQAAANNALSAHYKAGDNTHIQEIFDKYMV